jgi:hypothetical protein
MCVSLLVFDILLVVEQVPYYPLGRLFDFFFRWGAVKSFRKLHHIIHADYITHWSIHSGELRRSLIIYHSSLIVNSAYDDDERFLVGVGPVLALGQTLLVHSRRSLSNFNRRRFLRIMAQ